MIDIISIEIHRLFFFFLFQGITIESFDLNPVYNNAVIRKRCETTRKKMKWNNGNSVRERMTHRWECIAQYLIEKINWMYYVTGRYSTCWIMRSATVTVVCEKLQLLTSPTGALIIARNGITPSSSRSRSLSLSLAHYSAL